MCIDAHVHVCTCVIVFSVANFGSDGNCFHGTGGRNTTHSQLLYALKVVMSIANLRDEWILQDLHEQGIVPLLLGKKRVRKECKDSNHKGES